MAYLFGDPLAIVTRGLAYTVTIEDPDYPDNSDVRDGTIFNLGLREGTLDLPAESDVKFGVSFDNNTKTGTYIIDPDLPLGNPSFTNETYRFESSLGLVFEFDSRLI